MKEPTFKKIIIDLVLMVIGVATMFGAMIIGSITALIAGLFFIVVGWIPALLHMYTLEKNRKLEEKLKRANQGVIWIWAVCLIGIVVYSIAWFTLGWAAMSVIESVEASYTFPAPADTTIALVKMVIAWHPIFFILGLLLWAFARSQRPQEVTYPYA